MCFTTLTDEPTVFHRHLRRARKEYACSECRRPILPGRRYECCWGIWENKPQTFRTCMLCVDLRGCIQAVELAVGCDPEEAIPPFGALMEALLEGGAEDADDDDDPDSPRYPAMPVALQAVAPRPWWAKAATIES